MFYYYKVLSCGFKVYFKNLGINRFVIKYRDYIKNYLEVSEKVYEVLVKIYSV